MERKPQQQTLSIRISDALREFLERSKHVMSNGRGESVSTSDVAKILLESAKDDRLDFRLEVAELQQSPTQALWTVRRKWEQKRDLSRAEWIFLAQYIQVACEEISGTCALPGAESFATLIEAWLALRGLRTELGTGLDRYYLGNLGSDDGTVFNERQLDNEVASGVGAKLIRELRESPDAKRPEFAGRNFYVAVRDEVLPDVVVMNRVRELVTSQTHRVTAPGFDISFQLGSDGELAVNLSATEKDVAYVIAPYPQICEFFALTENLNFGAAWEGIHFRARVVGTMPGEPQRFYFRRPSDGVELGFSEQEWSTIKQLIAEALATPWLKQTFSELSLAYGEL
jgi:hypothetical protein